ncbi:hypothetical protein EDF56_101595 [Novosphingobium sp. PhB165]|uniref:hypothetical protein n=1 Tax=Novosphingobium sp. PhB165 TaxID=2485105 RepID=UPI0010F1410C|nr:hypothetical protein [Novosphingobium sp. PhB165]TCM21918.1 hypothetical protein EDF56_101595 [Novosphingobium sp. PhB165]
MRSEALDSASPLTTARRALGTESHSRGPWLLLLSDVLHLAGPRAEFQRHAERPWSSATFSGSRHTIALEFTGRDGLDAGEALIAALPDHEFTLPGQLVADATIAGVDHVAGSPACMIVEVELLLLDET